MKTGHRARRGHVRLGDVGSPPGSRTPGSYVMGSGLVPRGRAGSVGAAARGDGSCWAPVGAQGPTVTSCDQRVITWAEQVSNK